MSQANVDVVRGLYESTNVRDWAAARDAYADDVVMAFHGNVRGVGSDSVLGKPAVIAWFADWFRSFGDDYRFEVDELRDWGDSVLMIGAHHARGRTSGVAFERRAAWIYVLRDRKIVRCDVYDDPEQALRSAGVES